MVAVEGQFTFTAERPQLNCAVFFIGEPSDIISIEYDSVNIDCRGGDFVKVKCSYIPVDCNKAFNSIKVTYFVINNDKNSWCVCVNLYLFKR